MKTLTKIQHVKILAAYIRQIPTDHLRRVAQSAAACDDALFEGNKEQQRLAGLQQTVNIEIIVDALHQSDLDRISSVIKGATV